MMSREVSMGEYKDDAGLDLFRKGDPALKDGLQGSILSPVGQCLIGGLAQSNAVSSKGPGDFFAGEKGRCNR